MSDKQERLIKEIEEMLGWKVKGLTIQDLIQLSNEMFCSYNDLIGHRIDALIADMKMNSQGVIR
jgi:hypothetical protein